MEFKKSYSLKKFDDDLKKLYGDTKITLLYRVSIIFKNGKVKTYRRCIFYLECKNDICLRVLDRKGYEINIIKIKYYIKDIKVDVSGLAWDYQYGKYFYRWLFNEIYFEWRI